MLLLVQSKALDEVPYKLSGAVAKLAGITFQSLAFSYLFDKPWFLTEGRLATVLIIPSSRGSQLGGYLPASMDKSSISGMPMSPQEISKKYKRQCLGMPKAPPSSSTKYQVIFQDTLFLLLHMLCVVLGASLFLFLVFFCFVCYSILLVPSMFVLERDMLRFHCSEHSSFHSYCSVSVLFC
jgi:hypothetical protein